MHVRAQDRVRPQRRGAQPLEDAALAVDRDDRHQRQHGVQRDQHARRASAGRCRRTAARAALPVRVRGRTSGPAPTNSSTGIGDRPDRAERLAQEDLDLQPGQFPQSAQHRRPSSVADRMTGQPRNTSSSVGSTVRKSVTRIRCSARHWITCVTRPSPRAANGDLGVDRRLTSSTAGNRPEPRFGRLVVRSSAPRRARGSAARSSRAGVSMSTMRPWSMIATRSHSRSASSIRCVVRNTVLPRRADAAHQLPDRAPRLRIEAGRQLVEKDDFGIVDQRQRDEQPLLLAARQRHEPGVALLDQPELLEQPIAVRPACGRATPTGRPPPTP